jgi:Neuraminidase (sialidase)
MNTTNSTRPTVYSQLVIVLVLILGLSIQTPAAELERYIAIDNVCAWPNLTQLKDGTIIASIFNHPSHGQAEGDVECWASSDGRLWRLRGVAAPHEPATNRMNVAAGMAHDGSLIVLASGWGGPNFRGKILKPWVNRSSDGGKTWTRSESVTIPKELDYLVPFGDVIKVSGKVLAAPFYYERTDWSAARDPKRKRTGTSYLLFSKDDGLTWGEAVVIAPDDYNETAVLRLGPDRWLAATRTFGDGHLDLYVSKDEGRTWTQSGPLTLPSHHPAHLMKLADGRILLTYGIRERNHQGIGIRLSDDQGQTWKAPTRLVNLEGTTDGGYPATVQLTDGTLVTAYYSNGIPQHRRYHMGVVRWKIEDRQ